MNELILDLRCAVRAWSRHPGFGIAALLALAPGLAAATTIFCLLDSAETLAEPHSHLAALAVAVAGLLFLVFANTATLLLAVAAARRQELALRGALGATRRRLSRLAMTASMPLALAGGAAALPLAAAVIRFLSANAPSGSPGARVGVRAVLFTMALAAAVGWACGLLAARHAGRGGLGDALGAASPAGAAGAAGAKAQPGRRCRRWLVVVETALALALLATAGLALKSFLLLRAVDDGFAAAGGVLTASIEHLNAPPGIPKPFYGRLLGRLAHLPGIGAAALTSALPLEEAPSTRLSPEEPPPPEGGPPPMPTCSVDLLVVTPAYFQVMGVRLLQGRPLTARDDTAAPLAIIVNQTYARLMFPGEDPVGRRVRLATDAAWRRVVGVAADVREYGANLGVLPLAYIPYSQVGSPLGETDITLRRAAPPALETPDLRLVVRAAGAHGAAALAGPIRQVVADLDPRLALADVKTLDTRLDEALGDSRAEALLAALSAGLFLALAAAGIFGAVSCSVALRGREIAIRQALGVTRPAMLRLVLREGLSLACRGALLGIAGVTPFRLGMLCLPPEGDVPGSDAAVVAMVALLLLAVAGLASALPAVRAARLDLGAALRESG